MHMLLLKSIAAVALAASVTMAGAVDGLISVNCPVVVKKTTSDQVQAQAKRPGMAIFPALTTPWRCHESGFFLQLFVVASNPRIAPHHASGTNHGNKQPAFAIVVGDVLQGLVFERFFGLWLGGIVHVEIS